MRSIEIPARPARRAVLGALALAASVACAPAEATALRSETDTYTVELREEVERDHDTLRTAVERELVLDVVDKRSGRRSEVVVPATLGGDTDGLISLHVAGDRLLVVGRLSLVVIDLPSGESLLQMQAHDATPSPDGRRVAFKTFHGRWTPPEALSSVVQVLDVADVSVWAVYPEAARIQADGRGTLHAWVEDAAEVEQAGRPFWSPDGERLAFVTQRGTLSADGAEAYTLVRVSVGNDATGVGLARRTIERDRYVSAEARVDGRRNLLGVESLRWLDDDTVALIRPESHWWMPPEVELDLP